MVTVKIIDAYIDDMTEYLMGRYRNHSSEKDALALLNTEVAKAIVVANNNAIIRCLKEGIDIPD